MENIKFKGGVILSNINTKFVHGDYSFDEKTGAISYPIYQSATFKHLGLNNSTGFDYSRESNPTRQKLENTLSVLEEGSVAFAYSTGMAAISNLFNIFSSKDHIIVSNDLYGGTYRIFQDLFDKHYGIEFTYVDTSKVSNIENAAKTNTKAIFIETPTNPMMKISDIRSISSFTKEKGVLLIVDNTFLTPYFQKPLKLGADIVVHSGTKFLGGHNDLLAGAIILKENNELEEKLKMLQKTVGSVLAPFDSWLLLRGIKTLGIRMEKQQENAFKIVRWLQSNNKVDMVFYPGISEHEGHKICKNQSIGYGSMISFTVKDINLVKSILEGVKIISFAESLGGVESLITYPMLQTHSAIPTEILDSIGITDKLLRLSVGIEDVEDLIKDLEKSMR